MFTAKFKSQAESEQKFVIERPQVTADTSKVPDRDVAIIKIAVDSVTFDTTYYYEVANETDREQIWVRTDAVPAELKDKAQLQVSVEVLDELVRNTRLVRPETQFAIDADKKLRFKWISDAMDVLRMNRATTFNYVTEKKQ